MDIKRTPFQDSRGHGNVLEYTIPADPTIGSPEIPILTKSWDQKEFDTINGPKSFTKGDEILIKLGDRFEIASITGIRASTLDIAYNTIRDSGQIHTQYYIAYPGHDEIQPFTPEPPF